MGTRLWRTSLHLQLLAGRHTLQARAHHEHGQEDAAHKNCVRKRVAAASVRRALR